MAEINGTLNAVISGSDKILNSKSSTLTVNVDLPDASTKDDDGWMTHINGARDWSISINGTYDEAGSGVTPNEIMAAIIARTADTTMKFTTDGATGAAGWTGDGTYQNLVFTGDMEQAMTFSVEIKGNGALAAIV